MTDARFPAIALLAAVSLFLPTAVVGQPLQNRILIATSSDGLAWQRLNVGMADSGDVPDAVIGLDGNVRVYFQGLWLPTVDGIMVAVSPDGVTGWAVHQVQIAGTSGWPGRPCDPDMVVAGGVYRLYFTGDPVGDLKPETYSAVSTDGIDFTLEPGVRFQIAGSQVLDPSVLWACGVLQYFAGGAPPGGNWHGHSADGLAFARQSDFSAENILMANGLALASGFRFYGFMNSPAEGIRSLYSPDGESWAVEPGYRLNVDPSSGLESLYVKDPAVVMKDGLFLMYYVTRKSQTGGIDDPGGTIGAARLSATPNPFRDLTTVTFRLPYASRAILEVNDAAGRRIANLWEGRAGRDGEAMEWRPASLPQGVFFLTLRWDGRSETYKVVHLEE